jgi:hypothetical protein
VEALKYTHYGKGLAAISAALQRNEKTAILVAEKYMFYDSRLGWMMF